MARRTHTPRTHRCNKCMRFFANKSGLAQHKNSSHTTDARPRQLDSKTYTERHPVLNGFFLSQLSTICKKSNILPPLGRPCDIDGNTLPRNTPPPPPVEKSPTDWAPFDSRLEFELADLLFRRDEMSNGVLNDLLRLWAADKPDGHPPFADHKDMHQTIDAIEDGDAPWTSFKVSYSGPVPEEGAPGWMTEEYVVCHRDPRQVIHNLLANPEFHSGFSYAPYRQFENDERRWTDFMSGNWAWRQAASTLMY